MLLLGIDDAGRGPVIGPMVLAGVLIDAETEKEFKKLGIKDSKQLTPNKREILATIIREKAIGFHVSITPPNEIDTRINTGTNLNKLEAIKAAEIINKINLTSEKETKIKVVLDCPSNNIPAWIDYVKPHIKHLENLKIIGEHKADVNHMSVAAASILAKTTRDKEIEKIKKNLGVDFGSGYPSDPITSKFLKDCGKKYRKDGIFRETWATWKDVFGKKDQKNLLDFK
ncbi:MAG: ribonuclease HII [archaeon]